MQNIFYINNPRFYCVARFIYYRWLNLKALYSTGKYINCVGGCMSYV